MEFERLERLVQVNIHNRSTKCIKFGVINGRCNQVVMLNATDLPLTRGVDVDWKKLLEKITARSFSGTLIIEMNNGDVVGYAYSHTYSGESLRRLLG